MSVTKEDPLDLYIDFLNVDLSVDPRPKLKKGRLKELLDQFEREEILPDRFNLLTGEPRLKPDYSFLVFLFFKFCPFLAYIYFRFLWIEKAKNLQAEMHNDLFPIAARKEIPEKLFPTFERWACLTEKLNEMNFIRRWDPHPDKAKKGEVIVKAWNFKPDYNQRDIWYIGLAERLENGDIHKLRLCPVCHNYFAATRKSGRFCSKNCKKKYDNKDAKFRVQKWRTKQIQDKQKKEKNKQYEQAVNRFFDFCDYAWKNSQDTKYVGPTVIKIGKGAQEGWRILKDCKNKLKNGMSRQQVFDKLPQKIKDIYLSEN